MTTKNTNTAVKSKPAKKVVAAAHRVHKAIKGTDKAPSPEDLEALLAALGGPEGFADNGDLPEGGDDDSIG